MRRNENEVESGMDVETPPSSLSMWNTTEFIVNVSFWGEGGEKNTLSGGNQTWNEIIGREKLWPMDTGG